MTKYKDPVVKEFALRTRANLQTLRELQKRDPQAQVYEFTQLINSMLGLLVFPKEEYFHHIPRTPISDLQGWPVLKVVGNHPQARDLRDLIRLLRNAITHFNISFLSSEGELIGIQVQNKDGGRTGNVTWAVELTKEDMEQMTDKFIELLEYA